MPEEQETRGYIGVRCERAGRKRDHRVYAVARQQRLPHLPIRTAAVERGLRHGDDGPSAGAQIPHCMLQEEVLRITARKSEPLLRDAAARGLRRRVAGRRTPAGVRPCDLQAPRGRGQNAVEAVVRSSVRQRVLECITQRQARVFATGQQRSAQPHGVRSTVYLDAEDPGALTVAPAGSGVRPGRCVQPLGGSDEQAAEAEAGIVDSLARNGIRQLDHEVDDGGRRQILADLPPVPAGDSAQCLVENLGGGPPARSGTHLDLMHPFHQARDERWVPFSSGDHERRHVDQAAGDRRHPRVAPCHVLQCLYDGVRMSLGLAFPRRASERLGKLRCEGATVVGCARLAFGFVVAGPLGDEQPRQRPQRIRGERSPRLAATRVGHLPDDRARIDSLAPRMRRHRATAGMARWSSCRHQAAPANARGKVAFMWKIGRKASPRSWR